MPTGLLHPFGNAGETYHRCKKLCQFLHDERSYKSAKRLPSISLLHLFWHQLQHYNALIKCLSFENNGIMKIYEIPVSSNMRIQSAYNHKYYRKRARKKKKTENNNNQAYLSLKHRALMNYLSKHTH